MKLLMYIFEHEDRFDANDKYTVSVTKTVLDRVRNSPKVYEENKYELSLLEDMMQEGELPIPGEYFNIGRPYLYLVEKDANSIQAFTEDGLKTYMKAHGVEKLEYDLVMYVRLDNKDNLEVYGTDRALSSSALSDFIYRRTSEKQDYKISTGVKLKLSSGEVQIHGKAQGYVLAMQGKYEHIMNTLMNRDKEYVTKIYYNYQTNTKYEIALSGNAVFILDRIKDDIYRKDREVFGNIYTKAKSNIPIEADFNRSNYIYAIEVQKNGVKRILTPDKAESASYKDKDDNPCVMKIANAFILAETCNLKAVEIDYRLEPTGYAEQTLKSKDSFRVKVSDKKGIECRVAGICKVPSNYRDKLNGQT